MASGVGSPRADLAPNRGRGYGPPGSAVRGYWHNRARKLWLRVNIGWALALAAPRVGAVALLAAVICLGLRHLKVDHGVAAWVAAASLGLACLSTAVAAWPRRYRRSEALSRLDASLGLQGALLGAEEGLVPWPQPLTQTVKLRWRLKRVLPGLLAAPAVLLMSFWVPVQARRAPAPVPKRAPIVWNDMQQALQVLEEQSLIDEQTVDAWQEQLQELQALPPDTWFEHESLEAADTLWEQMRSTVARAEQAVLPVERALKQALQAESVAQRAQAQTALQRALSQLETSAQPLHAKLAEQLANLEPKDLPSMSRKELQALQQQLARARAAARRAQGRGEGQGEGEPEPGPPGQGEVQRGPGTAPIQLSPQVAPRLGDKTDSVDLNSDPRRDAMGDLTRVDSVAPEVDEATYRGLMRSGGTVHTGKGGEAVWKLRLTPAEQLTLRKYFE